MTFKVQVWNAGEWHTVLESEDYEEAQSLYTEKTVEGWTARLRSVSK